MRLHFVDVNRTVADALRECFLPHPAVEVVCGNILDVARHCVVSPANSLGYMDGGIDAAYLAFFGVQIQSAVHAAIGRRPEGMLPVGAAIAVRTGNGRIPYLVIAATMAAPEEVPPSHAGRALRAILRLVDTHPEIGEDIYCPGLATGVGRVSPLDAARSMLSSYEDWKTARLVGNNEI